MHRYRIFVIGFIILALPLNTFASRAIAIDHPGAPAPGSGWSSSSSWVSGIAPWSGVDTVFIGASSWIAVNSDITYDGIVIVEGNLNMNGSGTDINMDYSSMIKIQVLGILMLDTDPTVRLTQNINVGSRTYTSVDSDDGGAWYFDHELAGPAFITASGSSSDWTDDSIWSDNFGRTRAPATGDSIIIPAGVDVHIPASTTIDLTGSNSKILVYGSLELDGGTDSEIQMDGGSDNYVYIHTYNSSTGDGALEVIGPIIQNGSSFSASHDSEPANDGLGDNNTVGGFGKIIDGAWDNMLGPLPVKLKYFTGHSYENQVQLQWQTTEEINFSYFEVQRSFDGRAFITVGKVPGKGGIKMVANYDYHDLPDRRSFVYYRLKSVDFDGSFELSRVIGIDQFGEVGRVKLYPNPVTGDNFKITLVWEAQPGATILLMDKVGNIVYKKEVGLQFDGVVSFPHNLASGVYLLKLDNDHRIQTARVVVN